MAGQLMESALVTWVGTFKDTEDGVLTYEELSDGIFLNGVMAQIDARPQSMKLQIIDPVDDVVARLNNWEILVTSIKSYYKDVLEQLILLSLPNILAICKEPDKEHSQETEASNEIHKALLLILGCAVQCVQKEKFIEIIKALDFSVQHSMVDHIKEMTEVGTHVLPLSLAETDDVGDIIPSYTHHLQILLEERNHMAMDITKLTDENRNYQEQMGDHHNSSMHSSPEKHHLGVELADCKAKLRRLHSEMEVKIELSSEQREEIAELKMTLSKLRNENVQLTQDARAARTYRDELDVYKEKASRVDKCELELSRYKDKIQELDYYRTRVEELREDNKVLIETKEMLEDQIAMCHKRIECVMDLENEIIKYRQQVEELTYERDEDKLKVQDLLEENSRLEYDKNTSMNKSGNLEQELEEARSHNTSMPNTLSEQLNDVSSQNLKLQLEIQRLQKLVDELKEKSRHDISNSTTRVQELAKDNARLIKNIERMQDATKKREDTLTEVENTAMYLELEKENNKLAKKVDKLQESFNKTSETLLDLQRHNDRLLQENSEIKDMVDIVSENKDCRIHELTVENAQLEKTIKSLRARADKTLDSRTRAVEKENLQMQNNVKEMTTYITRLEFEKKKLAKEVVTLQVDHDQVTEFKEAQKQLEEEKKKAVATLTLTSDKMSHLEDKASDLEVENKSLLRRVGSVRGVESKVNKAEREKLELLAENQRLQRTIKLMRNSSSKLSESMNSNDSMNFSGEFSADVFSISEDEIEILKKSVKMLEQQKLAMESNANQINEENKKLKKSLSDGASHFERYIAANEVLTDENQRLQKLVEVLQTSLGQLEPVKQEKLDLEKQFLALNKERSSVKKENQKFRQEISVKDRTIEEYESKALSLEKEVKSLGRNAKNSNETFMRLRDLEKENQSLLADKGREGKTLEMLREDLVNEKIITQQLRNKLDKLRQEFERIGLDIDKLGILDGENGGSHRAIELLLEEAVRKSTEGKDHKIQTLETRLYESESSSLKAKDELKKLHWENESLKDKQEELKLQNDNSGKVSRTSSLEKISTAKEILEMKDHLIKVERTNATYMADNKNLTTVINQSQEREQAIERRNMSLQSQIASLQGHNNAQQSQFARLQVEYTTVQSQNSSLMTQHTQLQIKFDHLDTECQQLRRENDDIQTAHEQLVDDHEAIQQLHEQLSGEYEALISEHGSLKSVHKALKSEVHELKKKLQDIENECVKVETMKAELKKQMEEYKTDSRKLETLNLENKKLADERDSFKNSADRLGRDLKDSQKTYKDVKSEHNELKLKHLSLQGELGEYKDQLTAMEVEVAKMGNHGDLLTSLNNKLEEENKQLIMQLQQLLQQNQDLLTQTLNSKEHYHEEARSYMEQLANLQRQKERLEEKIMDQFKRHDPSPRKSKGFGANLVRKAKGFISKRPRDSRTDRDRTRMTPYEYGHSQDHSPDNSSLGSYGDSIDGTDVLGRGKFSMLHRGSISSDDLIGDGRSSLSQDDRATSLHSVRTEPRASRGNASNTIPLQARSATVEHSPGNETITLAEFLGELDKNVDKIGYNQKARNINKHSVFAHDQWNSALSESNENLRQVGSSKIPYSKSEDLEDRTSTPNYSTLQYSKASNQSNYSVNNQSQLSATMDDQITSTPKPESATTLPRMRRTAPPAPFTIRSFEERQRSQGKGSQEKATHQVMDIINKFDHRPDSSPEVPNSIASAEIPQDSKSRSPVVLPGTSDVERITSTGGEYAPQMNNDLASAANKEHFTYDKQPTSLSTLINMYEDNETNESVPVPPPRRTRDHAYSHPNNVRDNPSNQDSFYETPTKSYPRNTSKLNNEPFQIKLVNNSVSSNRSPLTDRSSENLPKQLNTDQTNESRPSETNEDDPVGVKSPGKNSVWYEYGCV